MGPAYELPRFTASQSDPETLSADLIAVTVPQDDHSSAKWLDQVSGQTLAAAAGRGEFKGKPCETWAAPSVEGALRGSRVVAVGLGPLDGLTTERARRVGATIGLMARQQKRAKVAVVVEQEWSPATLEALVEGLVLANYDNGHHKSKQDDRFFVGAIELASRATGDLAAAIQRGTHVGEAVNAARVLINEPGNALTPRAFMAEGERLLAVPGVTTEVLDEQRIEQLGMGLLLGVARGSAEPPRLLVARYEPAGAPAAPVIGLVGKGITFDTGGISLKPADGMERMKDDMAGGATVIAALRAIALEQLPVRVIAIVPSTENMPGGKALKPGDIIRGASGLTVEVNNTDAEGRLILGDGLWYAKQLGATHLVDVATLTGACVVALGKITTGLFATEGMREALVAAAERGGEKVWPMPLFEEYRESLKSEIADMLNSPGRPAGAVTAAMFLKEFVGETPWAHLDIAGTAWSDETRAWTPKGATGVMIRTLVELARGAGHDWP
jgi:leucyl aminopeptidase